PTWWSRKTSRPAPRSSSLPSATRRKSPRHPLRPRRLRRGPKCVPLAPLRPPPGSAALEVGMAPLVSRREFLRLTPAGSAVATLAAATAPVVVAAPAPARAAAGLVAQATNKLIIGCGGTLEITDPQRAIDLQNTIVNRLYSVGLLD